MADDNPYAAPLADLTPPRDPEEVGVWRDGDRLVMSKEATLPDRCVRCNRPALGWSFMKTMDWHHPLIYFFLLMPLLYIVAVLAARQVASVRLPLCPEHRRLRLLQTIGALTMGLLGPALIVAATSIVPGLGPGILTGLTLALGFGLATAGIIVATISSMWVTAARIDRRHVWLKGVSPELLATLPHWSSGVRDDGSTR